MKEKYYVYCGQRLCKSTNKGNFFFVNGQWVIDTKHLISDALIGYDATDSDTCYAIGNTDVMDRLQPVTEEEAKDIEDKQCEKK